MLTKLAVAALCLSVDATTLSRRSRNLQHSRLLALRGGSAVKAPEMTLNKVVPEWSGTTADLGIGAAVGMACGFTIGTTISTATKTAVSLTTFVISQTAFAFGLSRIAANLGLITIHWERFAFLGWKVFRVLDVDGDGKLTQMDLNLGAGRVLPPPLRKKFFNMIDADGDGKLTSKDAQLLSKGNAHAAAGGALGFVTGLVKGLGLK
jgi:uncharacterized membrane protein (Fun14 family)